MYCLGHEKFVALINRLPFQLSARDLPYFMPLPLTALCAFLFSDLFSTTRTTTTATEATQKKLKSEEKPKHDAKGCAPAEALGLYIKAVRQTGHQYKMA